MKNKTNEYHGYFMVKSMSFGMSFHRDKPRKYDDDRKEGIIFDKVCKCILSCKTKDQYESAKNMFNTFVRKTLNNFQIHEIDRLLIYKEVEMEVKYEY